MKHPGFSDGLCFEDNENGVIFNHFSFCEFIKHLMVSYANLDYATADEKVRSSFLAEVPESLEDVQLITHELDYHWAMLLAHWDMYWTKGIPSDYNTFRDEYLVWARETRRKYNLKKSYEYYDRSNN